MTDTATASHRTEVFVPSPSSAYVRNPVAAAKSIIPSMPMFTTPERSHHRPAIAPSAIGVPSANDCTKSCITFVSCASESARDKMITSGTSSTVESRRAPLARRGQRRSKNVAMAQRTKIVPIAATITGGLTVNFTGSGGLSKLRPLSAVSMLPAT